LKFTLRHHEQPLLLAAAGAASRRFCAAPLARLLADIAFASTSTLRACGRSPWILLARSLLLATAVTAGALLIGAPMGLLITRETCPRGGLMDATPSHVSAAFLLALGWFTLRRAGPLGGETTAQLLFSVFGLIAILVLTFSPVVSSMVALALLGMDASLEEAARAIARPWSVATRILLPAARPALVLAALVVFTLTVSELGVPMFLRVEVFPAAVFARLGGVSYAPGEAFALALPLLPVALGLLAIERRFAGARAFAVGGLRGMSRAPLPLGRSRRILTAAAWTLAMIGALPIGALALRAAVGNGYSSLPQWIGRAPWTSVTTAAVAATIIAALGLVVGHAVARHLRGASTVDAIAVLAFVTPASVLGIGLIGTWMNPATRAVYSSIAILIIGYVARYAIVGIRAAAAVIVQSPVHLEDLAAASGAGFWRRLTRIVLPVNSRGIAAAWLLAMVFCLRDFETAVLYYPPGSESLPVRIFTLEANGPGAVVAALALTHVLLIAIVLGAGLLLATRRRPQ
jgi:iron(III) transport system permease protein